MTAMYLINTEILSRFRNHPEEWQNEWKGNISNVRTFHPWQQSLMDECVEACAALLWWGHYGSQEDGEAFEAHIEGYPPRNVV